MQPRTRSAPTITNLPTAWLLLGALFAGAGSLVISTTWLPAASGHRHEDVVRSMDLLALLTAAAVVIGHRRMPATLLNPVLAASTVLISVATLASGGGSTAVAYATVYLITPIYCRFVLPRRQANAQLLVTLCLGIPTLAVQPGVGAGEQLVLWGVALMECLAVVWLVHALQQAETDRLTGLLNRAGVERALSDLVSAPSGNRPVAVVVVDLDRFRAVNETLGRPAGDDVLRATARAWVERLGDRAEVGRTSGDGFAVALRVVGPDQARDLATELRRIIASPFGASAGVALAEAGEEGPALLARAEAAARASKHEGPDRTTVDRGRGVEAAELRTALTRGQFVPFFQPIVDLHDRSVVGAEALVRWQHPERGLVPPLDFLRTAERSGLMIELGAAVLTGACRTATSWPAAPGRPAPYVAVNASARELQDPSYATTVREALDVSGLDPRRLVIELVESQYEAESIHLVENLVQLRELGVRTALDDFGVGYSSLDRLRRLTSDIIKIDKSFVDDIVAPDQDVPLVMAVLALGSALGLRVVAEGIEEPVQARWLAEHGCHLGQGWLFSRALPAAEFDQLLIAEALKRLRPATGS